MAPAAYMYPLDPSGNNPNNLIINEEHLLGTRNVRAIAPHHGGYFSETLIIREKGTQRILVKDEDYYCAEQYGTPSFKYGKEIYSIIVITDATVTGAVLISYQTLGGPWGSSQQAMIQMFDRVNTTERPVDWGAIFSKLPPMDTPFSAARASESFGFEYVVSELEKLYQVNLMGDRFSHDEIYQYIDNLIDALFDKLDEDIQAHGLSIEHDWRYFTKNEMDGRYTKKGENIDIVVDGPLTINRGTQYSWQITNFNAFSNYLVRANQGIVNINRDKIFFTLPAGDPINDPLLLTVTRDGVERELRIRIL